MSTTATGYRRYMASSPSADQAAPTLVSATQPANMIEMEAYYGCRVQFIGKGAGGTMVPLIYVVQTDKQFGRSAERTMFVTRLFATLGTVTLGAALGVADGPAVADELFADEIASVTLTGYASKLGLYANSGVNFDSPAGDGIAELFIGDLANAHGIVIRFTDIGGGGGEATEANALINRDRL